MKTPNIFDYATSELSQDAFLCWLIACSYSEDESFKNIGLDFIRFLYNSTIEEGHKIEQSAVQGLIETEGENNDYPWQQYEKIDIYFQAKVDAKTVSFIIEDKTDTEMHSNQLEKYKNAIKEDGIKEDEVRTIYFKTGYIYSDEKEEATRNGYSVVDLEMFIEFLACHKDSVESEIFKSYVDYIADIKKQRDDRLDRAEDFSGDKDAYTSVFEHPYVQWEFILKLDKKIQEVLAEKEHHIGFLENGERFDRGMSMGGDPWTQYWWHRYTVVKYRNNIDEGLFWRMDGWYQLRLRHAFWPEKDEKYDGFDEDRKDRLNSYRKIFEEVGNKVFRTALKPPSGRTGYESTIGEIQFNSEENSVQNILERLPEFQRNFIEHASSEELLIK